MREAKNEKVFSLLTKLFEDIFLKPQAGTTFPSRRQQCVRASPRLQVGYRWYAQHGVAPAFPVRALWLEPPRAPSARRLTSRGSLLHSSAMD